MKGIREAAMSSAPDEPAVAPKTYGSYDGYDDYGAYNYHQTPPSTYKPKNSSLFDYDNYAVTPRRAAQKTIEVKINIPIEDIGAVADDTTQQYDWIAAQAKAEEIAYDRLGELLNPEYESKYTLTFAVYDDEAVYEVCITLTPNT